MIARHEFTDYQRGSIAHHFIDGQQMPVLAKLQENKSIVSVELYCVPTFSISCQQAIQATAAAELGVDKAGQICSCTDQNPMHLKIVATKLR